ncbi:hypothetical protein [Streptomyces sp. NPDC006510]|uniref:hypothetical protein n=1 Tax=Streptomyces sp. NPDC006510 TaxID=3155600 RepID=UPI0033A3ADC6
MGVSSADEATTLVGGCLTGHTEPVTTVATASVSGRRVAVSGSLDTTIRLWDVATARPVGVPLTGHTQGVYAMATAMVAGRPVAVSSSHDTTVRVWDLVTVRQVGRLPTGHAYPVWAVATSVVDGRPTAVTGCVDGSLRIWATTRSVPSRRPTSTTGPSPSPPATTAPSSSTTAPPPGPGLPDAAQWCDQPDSCACTADGAGTCFRRRWGWEHSGLRQPHTPVLRRYSRPQRHAQPAPRVVPPAGVESQVGTRICALGPAHPLGVGIRTGGGVGIRTAVSTPLPLRAAPRRQGTRCGATVDQAVDQGVDQAAD